MSLNRIFLLSPASCRGQRARFLLKEKADFPQSRRIRSPQGLPVGELFSFLSGLYFRGKLTYAQTFARPPIGAPGILIITPTRGLLSPDEPVTLELLQEFAGVDIKEDNSRYRFPLEKDARKLGASLSQSCEVVLLGSIATRKYLDVLSEIFQERLRFPLEFVGRGDMSRGGLLLRCVENCRELHYGSCVSTAWHGLRPPKLEKRR